MYTEKKKTWNYSQNTSFVILDRAHYILYYKICVVFREVLTFYSAEIKYHQKHN